MAEAAWQSKAIVCGHLREAQLIRTECKPFKVKKIATAIHITPEWEEQCEDVMQDILREKFQKNHFCSEVLLCTGDRKVFEETGDRRWGVGSQSQKRSRYLSEIWQETLLGSSLYRSGKN